MVFFGVVFFCIGYVFSAGRDFFGTARFFRHGEIFCDLGPRGREIFEENPEIFRDFEVPKRSEIFEIFQK